MKSKIAAGVLFGLLISLHATASLAEDSFSPAGSRIKTGDQKYAGHEHEKSPAVKKIFSAPVSAGFFLIRCYQIAISPQNGPACRFTPTCSAYGKTAVMKHGILAGSFLAGERLIRCNPYNKGGEDPVPEKIFEQ